jgi:hypothetical protein
MMLDDKCASLYWCPPLDGSMQSKINSQLTFKKPKWILKSYWKTENVSEVQKRRNESGNW